MVCENGHTFFDSEKSTKICWVCGVEEYVLSHCSYKNCGFQMRHSPFLSGYSRAKRFKGMVDALFWPTPSNPDTKMLEYLLTQKFSNRLEIIAALTTAPLKDKRFGSIHLFCRLMNPKYTEPVHGCLFQMLTRLVREFQCIEARFRQRFVNEPFINYTFLIRHLLTKLEFFSYLPFVKQLKCAKRRAKYMNMLEKLTIIGFDCSNKRVITSGTVLVSAPPLFARGAGLCVHRTHSTVSTIDFS